MARDTSNTSNVVVGPGGRVGQGGPGGPGSGPRGALLRPGEKAKDAKGTLKRLVKYIGRSKYFFIGLLVAVLVVTVLTIAGPALQERAISTLTFKEGEPIQVDFERLLMFLGMMLGAYLLSSVFTYAQGLFAAKLSQNTVRVMRRDLFAKLERLPISFLDSHRHGDIMSRMTNDVENVSNTISTSIASLITSVMTIFGVLIVMLLYSPILTLVSMVTIPLSIFATMFIARMSRKYFVIQQKLLGNLNAQAEEMITGYKTVVAYSREKRATEEFSNVSNQLRVCGIRAQIFGGIMGPVMNVIGNFGYLLIAAVGAYLALKGHIGIGVIQAFLLYSKQFTRPINEVANQYTQIQTALAGAERVFEILDSPDETNEGTVKLGGEAPIRGEIHFTDVDFAYKKGEPVLNKLSFDVKAGEKIAIVGATGSGKTTIVNLLLRFYEIDGGCISIDGTDISQIDKASLRRNVAIVLQDTVLFSDTIGANIRYGRDEAEQADIEAAAVMANADRFIELLPNGYDTVLAEGGSDLSGGQRQLLAIARAVLADPAILILDEATSSVDTRTEMQISMAMMALMQNRTSLIIAHRLSTIRNADKIVVIDEGRVIECGNHDELLEKQGVYYKLYQSQFAGIQT